MRSLFFLLILNLFIGCGTLFSQTTQFTNLFFESIIDRKQITLDSLFHKINSDDSVQFTSLKYYVSEVELLLDAKLVWKEEKSFHLIDAANSDAKGIQLKVPAKINYNQLKFTLGIDSTTSVSGAMGGDLDPTRGMYWTWQSGYINFKLEGRNLTCQSRNNKFQYHLGGYQYPYNSAQRISLSIEKKSTIKIQLLLNKIFDAIKFNQKCQIMSPCIESLELSKVVAQSFSTPSH